MNVKNRTNDEELLEKPDPYMTEISSMSQRRFSSVATRRNERCGYSVGDFEPVRYCGFRYAGGIS